MHADRTNRGGLTLLGVICLAAGLLGALAGFGAFGDRVRRQHVVDNAVGRYFSTNGNWLWPVIGLAALIIALLALRWLWTLLFSTDRAGTFRFPGDRSRGRTTIAPSALTDAVAAEVSGYRGVADARARMIGDSAMPRLVITSALDPDADFPAVRRRIETEAAAHARTAMGDPDLPVQLDLTVARSSTRSRVR